MAGSKWWGADGVIGGLYSGHVPAFDDTCMLGMC